MFLIDTDVLSALRRRERHDRIVQWMSSQRDVDIHLSVVTVGEIEREIAQQKHQDPAFAQQLTVWLDQILALYSDRVLAIDLPTARHWGRGRAFERRPADRCHCAGTRVDRGDLQRPAFRADGSSYAQPNRRNIWLYNSTFQQRYICTYRQDMVEYGSS